MKTLLMILGISTMVLAADGAALFQKCAACHGSDGSKSALGKSKIIKEMSQPEIVTALKGYQDGSYGGPMKALMKGQVATFSAEDIEAVAAFVAK